MSAVIAVPPSVAHGIVRTKPIAETTEDDWDAVLGVNAKATYFLCKEFGPLLTDGGSNPDIVRRPATPTENVTKPILFGERRQPTPRRGDESAHPLTLVLQRPLLDPLGRIAVRGQHTRVAPHSHVGQTQHLGDRLSALEGGNLDPAAHVGGDVDR